MNFYFRTNYNSQIGIGHYMRCYRLANFFEKKGHKCFIFIDKKNKNFLKDSKIKELYNINESFKNEISDSLRFINKIKKLKNGFVIVDDYRIGHLWEKKINNFCKKIISIDDFENRKHHTDIYINQKTKFLLEKNIDKNIFLKKNPLLLLGPKYSIIDDTIDKKKNQKFTVIFNFGGSGDLRHCYDILKKIEKYKSRIFKFIVIVGPLSKNKKLVSKLNKKINVQLIQNATNLNSLYAKSHIFIGSAGTSVYETINNKLLSLLFQVSDNQSNSIKALEKIGHYFFLDYQDLKYINKISKLILNLYKNYNLLKELAFKSNFKIDSNGKKRILEAIISPNQKKNKIFEKKKLIKSSIYSIRKVKHQDVNDYLYSRNSQLNRKFSFNNSKIKKIDHYNWWFENQRSNYALEKNNEVMLYFYHYPIFILNQKILISGWFVKNEKCNIHDILYALNWQRKLKKKKLNAEMWLSIVKKTNTIALKYNKYLGWNKLEKNSDLYKQIKKKYTTKGFYFFLRNIYD